MLHIISLAHWLWPCVKPKVHNLSSYHRLRRQTSSRHLCLRLTLKGSPVTENLAVCDYPRSATMIRGVGRKAISVARSCAFVSNCSRPIAAENGPGLKGLQELAHFNSPLGLSAWKFSGVRAFSSEVVAQTSEPPTVAALKNPDPNVVYDEAVHKRYPPGDPSKVAFTYFVMTGGRFIYASLIRLAIIKLIMSMSASKDVLALASLEVDLSNILPGSTVTVKWRGKPVFIRHRTEEDIMLARSVPLSELRDPEPDEARVIDPKWLVVIGVCTHLGCVPLPNAGDYKGWFCPCHGSHYDTAGRVRKGPAPYNLEVPTYKFLEEQKIMVG